MKYKKIIVLLLFIGLAIAIGYYATSSQQSAAHYLGNTVDNSPKGSSSGIIIYQPKITAIVAYKTPCLYCDVVIEDLKNKADIVRELNVNSPSQYNELLSYLNKLHVEYLGVPTVLIGHYAFFSYQRSNECPSYSTEVNIKVGNHTVKLCRIKDQPNYYVYIPDRVAELIAACKATKHPSCFLT